VVPPGAKRLLAPPKAVRDNFCLIFFKTLFEKKRGYFSDINLFQKKYHGRMKSCMFSLKILQKIKASRSPSFFRGGSPSYFLAPSNASRLMAVAAKRLPPAALHLRGQIFKEIMQDFILL
jgi:hypothetical protein